MVYLKIKVRDFDKIVNFYVEKLGLFDLVGDRRLVCKNGVDLIIDLRESENQDAIGKVGIGMRFDELVILEKLKESKIDYTFQENLAGQQLYIDDPDGNELWITTQSGDIS